MPFVFNFCCICSSRRLKIYWWSKIHYLPLDLSASNLKKCFQILIAFHFWLTSQREINVLSFTSSSLNWDWQILWPKSHGFSGNISPWELTESSYPRGDPFYLLEWTQLLHGSPESCFFIKHEDKYVAVVDCLQWWHPSIHMLLLLASSLLPLTLNLALVLVSTNIIWQTWCCTNSRVKALRDLTISIFTLWESSSYVEIWWGPIWRLRPNQLPAILDTWTEAPGMSAKPSWTF